MASAKQPSLRSDAQISEAQARNIAQAVWLLVDKALHSESGRCPLHEFIDPKTERIATRFTISIDPYTYFVYLYSAVRLGFVICDIEATFQPTIAAVKWFADNGNAVRKDGFTKKHLESFFKDWATIV